MYQCMLCRPLRKWITTYKKQTQRESVSQSAYHHQAEMLQLQPTSKSLFHPGIDSVPSTFPHSTSHKSCGMPIHHPTALNAAFHYSPEIDGLQFASHHSSLSTPILRVPASPDQGNGGLFIHRYSKWDSFTFDSKDIEKQMTTLEYRSLH